MLRNPAVLATAPALPDQARRRWTPEQVGQFLVFAAGHRTRSPPASSKCWSTPAAAAVKCWALRWQDLDLDLNTASVTRQLVADAGTKEATARPTKRPRSKSTIGLHHATVVVLRRRRAEQGEHRLKMGAGWPAAGALADGLVFTWADGTAIHPDVLTRTIRWVTARLRLGGAVGSGAR